MSIDNDDKYEHFRAKIRPEKSSHPRSKNRPRYADATQGFVIEAHLGRWLCVLDNGYRVWCVRARELGKHSIVVGDHVAIVGDISGEKDTLARIIKINPRDKVLRRSAEDTDSFERIVVAGCDSLLIVVAAANPAPKAGFIFRAIMAAISGGSTPIIAITKTDQGSPDYISTLANDIGIEWYLTGIQDDISLLERRLTDKVSALFGQSGVGKSTLFNRLIPEAHRQTGEVSAIGKGRHTSSTSVAFPFPPGGWLIDTPGLRSLGLQHVTLEEIYTAIPEIKSIAEECSRGCKHTLEQNIPDSQQDCALRRYQGNKKDFITLLLDIINSKITGKTR